MGTNGGSAADILWRTEVLRAVSRTLGIARKADKNFENRGDRQDDELHQAATHVFECRDVELKSKTYPRAALPAQRKTEHRGDEARKCPEYFDDRTVSCHEYCQQAGRRNTGHGPSTILVTSAQSSPI